METGFRKLGFYIDIKYVIKKDANEYLDHFTF